MEGINTVEMLDRDMRRRIQTDEVRITAAQLLRSRNIVTIEDPRPVIEVAIALGLMDKHGNVIAEPVE